jgi:glycosyltransferase involved in cell wall biosynthesis
MTELSGNDRGNHRPRVLVLDEEIPVPYNTGKRIRTWNLLRQLSGDFAIDMLTHSNHVTRESVAEMRAAGITPIRAASRIPEKRGLAFLARIALNLASPLPYSVASHYHDAYRQRLATLLLSGGYDLIHCEWTPYARYLRNCRLPWIVSAHNVEAGILHRMAEYESASRRLFFRLQARRMARFETGVFRRAGWITTVSDADARTIETAGGRDVTVVPNGVDIDFFTPGPTEEEIPGRLIFTGSMDWRPNQDAIRWFLKEIGPALPATLDWHLDVVGREPPAWLGQVCRNSGRAGTSGTVPDVRPYVHRAQIYVVPLRIGGGSRLKILEALAMEKAVVSTTVGIEGLDLEDGRHLVVADDPRDFAQRIASLIAEPGRRRELAAAGRRQVMRHCTWPRIAGRQAELWQRVIAAGRCAG